MANGARGARTAETAAHDARTMAIADRAEAAPTAHRTDDDVQAASVDVAVG